METGIRSKLSDADIEDIINKLQNAKSQGPSDSDIIMDSPRGDKSVLSPQNKPILPHQSSSNLGLASILEHMGELGRNPQVKNILSSWLYPYLLCSAENSTKCTNPIKARNGRTGSVALTSISKSYGRQSRVVYGLPDLSNSCEMQSGREESNTASATSTSYTVPQKTSRIELPTGQSIARVLNPNAEKSFTVHKVAVAEVLGVEKDELKAKIRKAYKYRKEMQAARGDFKLRQEIANRYTSPVIQQNVPQQTENSQSESAVLQTPRTNNPPILALRTKSLTEPVAVIPVEANNSTEKSSSLFRGLFSRKADIKLETVTNLQIPTTNQRREVQNSISDCREAPQTSFAGPYPGRAAVGRSGVIMKNPKMFTRPNISHLDATAVEGTCIVVDFVVGHEDYGMIMYPGVTDVFNANLDEIFAFERDGVVVYPDLKKLPPQGEGFNKPAVITYRKWPKDLREGITTQFTDLLRSACTSFNGQFISYDPFTGTWVFKIPARDPEMPE